MNPGHFSQRTVIPIHFKSRAMPMGFLPRLACTFQLRFSLQIWFDPSVYRWGCRENSQSKSRGNPHLVESVGRCTVQVIFKCQHKTQRVLCLCCLRGSLEHFSPGYLSCHEKSVYREDSTWPGQKDQSKTSQETHWGKLKMSHVITQRLTLLTPCPCVWMTYM